MRTSRSRGVLLTALVLLLGLFPAGVRAQAPADGEGLPLEPARWARFTTSEGTWLSLDVSSDGQTIAFDMLGDLYTIPIAGGTATRITDGIAHDMQPRFSPDGQHVVFVSDRSGDDNVWVARADGSDLRQITKDGGIASGFLSPVWTPDGNYIVVARSALGGGLEKLWLYHIRGGTGVQMTPAPGGLRLMGPAIGADGRYVWYSQRFGSWSYNSILPQYQIGVYDRKTGTRTTMSSRFGSAFRPALSPDGKWLTYGTRHDSETGLILRDLATGEESWLAYPIQRDEQESVANMDALPGYSFTPDSRAVVISYGGKIWSVPVDGSAPSNIPFTVNAEVAVGPAVMFQYPIEDTPTFTARQIRDAVPSPDGSRLVFTALDRLWVMDLPGGTPERLTRQEVGEFQPAWSPDGRSVAFVTWDEIEGHIMSVSSGGGNSRQLTSASGYYRQPAWSPDGERVVAIRSDTRGLDEAVGPFAFTAGSDFVWLPASGGGLTVIGSTAGRSRPHFTTDPDRIYSYGLTPAETGPRTIALVSTRWDNTDAKTHLRVTWRLPITNQAYQPDTESDILMPRDFTQEQLGEPGGIQGSAGMVVMAPQGDVALALVQRDVYVITVPQVGGQVPSVLVTKPDSAAMPVRKLTDVGGEFPAWSADGRTVHWSIGNAFSSYDLDRAEAVDDSLRQAGADSTAMADAAYRAAEIRVDLQVARDIPQGTVVLRGARVITMRGTEVIENADVVVENNRIASVGPNGSAPSGAQVIDVSGATIVPGFVDTHAHLRPLWFLHKTRPWAYLANLAYGVTTTRDPQTGTTDVLSYADRVRAGQIPGPRIYSTGPGVFWPEGIRSLDHARDVLRRYSDYWDTKTFKMYMSGNRRQRQLLIMASRELELMPTTEGGLDYRLNMTHAMDGYPGIEHNMPIIPAYGDVVQLFVTSQTTNTPTLLVTYGGPWAENYYFTNENLIGDAKLAHFTPQADLDRKIRRRNPGPGAGGWFMEDEYVFKRHSAWLKDLVDAGGRTGVGSHGQLQGLGYHWELWSVQSGGMSNHDALRVATLMGAEAIGLGGDLGSIEGGKLADLVVLEANPLDDIRNTNTVRYVMKNGRLYDGDTLDEIWPRQQPAADESWRHTAPTATTTIQGASK